MSDAVEDVEALAKRLEERPYRMLNFRRDSEQAAATLRAQAAQLAARPAPEDAVLIHRLRTDIRIDNEPPNYERQRRQAADRIEALSAQLAHKSRVADAYWEIIETYKAAPDVLAQVEAEIERFHESTDGAATGDMFTFGRRAAYANCLAIIRRVREAK